MQRARWFYVYWTVVFFAATVVIASLYDPANAEALFPFALQPGRFLRMIFSWPLLVCVVPTALGIAYARRVWAGGSFTDTEKMATIWFLTNATWYHIGCDVFSGLFQVMPNLTECYQAMNRHHLLPMHDPDRVVLDSIYWFELFVQMPLCYLTYALYLKRSRFRPAVELFLCGLHVTGTVAYYLPNLLLGEATHPVLSTMDRSIGSLWVVVPILLAVRAGREVAAMSRREPAVEPAVEWPAAA